MKLMWLCIMIVTALVARADEGLYGVWKGVSLDIETESEATIMLSLWEPDRFEFRIAENVPLEDAVSFWRDFDVEGPYFEILVMRIEGTFHVQNDSLLLEIYELYVDLESGDNSVDFFDVLAEVIEELMVTEGFVEEESEDGLELIKDTVEPMIGLLRLTLTETLSEELSGPYTLDGNTLYLGASWEEDVLTLHRQDIEATVVREISWGQLKLEERSLSK